MSRTRLFMSTALVALGITALACGGGELTTGSDTTPTVPSSTTTTTLDVVVTPPTNKPAPAPEPTVPLPSIPPGADPAATPDVAFAISDLAATLGVPEGNVIAVGWEEVVWRDGSIGCAQPGMAYTQALVDGMRIALEVDGTVYWYHAGGGREPFHCANPTQ